MQPMQDKDSVIFFNFRPDRAREITRAFCDDDFDGFSREKKLDVTFVCFTDYDETIPKQTGSLCKTGDQQIHLVNTWQLIT